MKEKNKISVVQDEEPIEKSILASAIVEMSQGVRRLQKSGLNFEAVVILTQAHCRPAGKGCQRTVLSRKDVRAVLQSLSELEKCYIAK